MKIAKITNSSKTGDLKPWFDGWLNERFGDHCAQISVVTTLRLKNAVKDVARSFLGSVPYDIEEMCKKFEMPPQGLDDSKFIMGYENEEGHQQGSIERDKALQQYINKYPKHWEIVKQALALPRQRGRHASAFLIADRPISSFIPMTSVSGVKVTAFTGPEVEAVGGVKMDFLVVTQMSDISTAIKLIQQRHMTGQYGFRDVLDPVSRCIFDIWNLPENLEVFKDVSEGRTESVFQFCTSSAKKWLKYFNYTRPNGLPAINNIEGMAIFTALDRPGPLDYEVENPDNPGQKHNMLVEYSRRIRGLNKSKDVVPVLDDLCKDTNGIMVFQESMQKVYYELTGCSRTEAEEFRSNIAKKKKEKIDQAYSFFIKGATKKIGSEAAQEVWNALNKWSAYGFCASHARSYATISYACAWLKHYYPLEWWTAVLTHAEKDEIAEKFWPYCHDKVLLPDISLSKANWAIEGDKIRAPISLLYGVGEKAHEQLMKYAPYRDKEHFCQSIIDYKKAGEDGWGRSAINIGTIYTLLVSGCMDSLYDPKNGLGVNLDDYQTTIAGLAKLEGKKIAKKKLDYPVLDFIGRYQIKKDVLPIFGDDLRPYVESPNLYRVDSQLFYRYKDYSYRDKKEIEYEDQVMSGEFVVECEKVTEMSGTDQKCVIAAYIEGCEVFNYGPNKSKEAKKFQIETCGIKREVVYWPSKDQRLPKEILAVKNGSVAIVVLSRYNVDKDFAVKKIEVVREPQTKKEAE